MKIMILLFSAHPNEQANSDQFCGAQNLQECTFLPLYILNPLLQKADHIQDQIQRISRVHQEENSV